MFENCLNYNGEQSQVSQMCREVQEEYNKQCELLQVGFYITDTDAWTKTNWLIILIPFYDINVLINLRKKNKKDSEHPDSNQGPPDLYEYDCLQSGALPTELYSDTCNYLTILGL